MDENIVNDASIEEYIPRPRWQVWLARAGVVIMIISVALWLYNIAFPA